jgi:hypothetical protein
MDTIEIQTLVDITNTRVVRPNQGSQLEMDQYRNFITLCQCAEIRSVINYEDSPTTETQDLKKLGFGTAYKGKHAVWTFRFNSDRAGVYIDDQGDPLGFLINDLDQVPVIKNLAETINIDKAIFELKDGRLKNTVIKAITGTT